MKFKKGLGYLLSAEDIDKLVDHTEGEITYKLLPVEKNDFDEENKLKIVELIKSAKSKPIIAEEAGISLQKLDLFLKDNYKTKKITAIRQILLKGLLTYDELPPDEKVTRRVVKKKEVK
jgi:hypothetical protein